MQAAVLGAGLRALPDSIKIERIVFLPSEHRNTKVSEVQSALLEAAVYSTCCAKYFVLWI